MNPELQEIQHRLKKMIELFDYYCRANNLCYFAWGGTMLGAIRHHGFIPWDDDIDLMMPRRDYNRLKELSAEHFINGYRIVGPHNQKNMVLAYMKMEDMNSTIVDNILAIDNPSGIFIDIMPLDGIPSNEHDAERLFTQYKRYQKHAVAASSPYTLKNVFSRGHDTTRITFSSYLKSLIFRVFFSSQHFYLKGETLISSYGYDNVEYVRVYPSPHFGKKKLYRTWLEESIDVEFEGIKIKCPAAYDEILTLLYKDYMTLPPIDKRGTDHKFFFLNLERRYSAGEIRRIKGI